MIARSKIKTTLMALSGAIFLGAFAQAAPVQARHWDGWGGYDRHVVVHRHVVRRPVVRRVVYVDRPVFYRPRPVVRRVVIVERPYSPRVRYGYGWHRRIGYRPGWADYRWHDQPRCWLPERYLCR